MMMRASLSPLTLTASGALLLLVAVLTASSPRVARAQISSGGTPHSFAHKVAVPVPTATMPSIDAAALRTADEAAQQQAFSAGRPAPPARFGKALDVSLGIENAGTWTRLPSGGRLWRLKIEAPGAHSINLIFDRFRLPPFARLFIYSADRETVLGAFTSRNNKAHGKFSTTPVPGEAIILEYEEPAVAGGERSQLPESRLRISKVVHGYRDTFGAKELGSSGMEQNGFGDSDESCQINVNCSAGADWQDEKRSVGKILTNDGQSICSGALVNNTRENNTPYFLTAFHCANEENLHELSDEAKSDIETWVFWFNYESDVCSNPSNEPEYDSISGANFVAGDVLQADFLLLKLSEEPPLLYNVYYAGWSWSGNTPSSTTSIHHPMGDLKKISQDDDPSVSYTLDERPDTGSISVFCRSYPFFPGCPSIPKNTHWKVTWDSGATANGSSGSPLFDERHRIVGVLTGGRSSCSNPDASDWYGKFSRSWTYGSKDSEELKHWLDPIDKDYLTNNGKEGSAPSTVIVPDITGPSTMCKGTLETWSSGVSPSASHTWAYREGNSGPWTVIFGQLGTSTLTYGFPNVDTYDITLSVDVEDGLKSGSDEVDISVLDNCSSAMTASTKSSSSEMLPDTLALEGSYPNPVRKTAQIRYSLPQASIVTLVLYDMQGREVARLVDGIKPAGAHRATFDASTLASGIYAYRMRAGDAFTDNGTLVVVK